MEKHSKRLLLIGPYDANHRFIGGATTSFREFCRFVDKNQIPHCIVDTRRFSGHGHDAFNLSWVIIRALVRAPRADVVLLHAARAGILYVGPLIYLMCAVWRRTFCLRPVGSDFAEIIENAPAWHRWVLRRTILKSDLVLFEIRDLTTRYSGVVPKAMWFPNVRPRAPRVETERSFGMRFVFLSQIALEKGVAVLLDAAEKLDASYTVDFFGPIVDLSLQGRLEASGRYRGVAEPDQVLDVLRRYDILVLPTFAPHEGYPGVIIEAYSIGMPVIATQWRSIPDVVLHGESGVLVAPGSVDELVTAMRSIDGVAFARLRAGALRKFDSFDGDRVHSDVLGVLLD